MQSPLVSIIITTKNESANIENCLKSIKSQTYSNYEIIVVDNKSTDNTKDIAKKYTDSVFDKGPERSAQRNFGVEKASGEYFLYLDADMILTDGIVTECVETCKSDPAVKALYIPEKIVGNGFWIKVRDFERSFYDGTVIDCVRFINKSTFVDVGGFDESFSGPEDWDLDKKIRNKGVVKITKSYLNHNEGSFDLDKYLGKKSYYAKSMDSYVEKWGKNDEDVVKQLGLFYRFLGVYIEKGKFLKLLLHPVYTLAMYYLRFRVGLAYILRKRTT